MKWRKVVGKTRFSIRSPWDSTSFKNPSPPLLPAPGDWLIYCLLLSGLRLIFLVYLLLWQLCTADFMSLNMGSKQVTDKLCYRQHRHKSQRHLTCLSLPLAVSIGLINWRKVVGKTRFSIRSPWDSTSFKNPPPPPLPAPGYWLVHCLLLSGLRLIFLVCFLLRQLCAADFMSLSIGSKWPL